MAAMSFSSELQWVGDGALLLSPLVEGGLEVKQDVVSIRQGVLEWWTVVRCWDGGRSMYVLID